MSILNLLKKFKLPGFEDDFIEDPAEKAIAEAPKARGRVICDPRKEGHPFLNEDGPNLEGLNPDPLRDWEWADLTSGDTVENMD